MDARERRRAIMAVLESAKDPVSGSALAREVGVSRQVVVQDIALLRADGHDIVATNRGYVLQEAASSPAVPTRLVKVRTAWSKRAMSSRASSTRAAPCST